MNIFFRNSPKLSFTDWNKYLDEIAKNKKVDANALKGKLVECGKPGFTGATVRFLTLSLYEIVIENYGFVFLFMPNLNFIAENISKLCHGKIN